MKYLTRTDKLRKFHETRYCFHEQKNLTFPFIKDLILTQIFNGSDDQFKTISIGSPIISDVLKGHVIGACEHGSEGLLGVFAGQVKLKKIELVQK